MNWLWGKKDKKETVLGGIKEETLVEKVNITKNRVLKRNESQGERILAILKENPDGLTRYEIRDFYKKYYGDILDTSLSRAISCLSYDSSISMTDRKKMERYGAECFIYKAKQ
jgi:hypothetical protein